MTIVTRLCTSIPENNRPRVGKRIIFPKVHGNKKQFSKLLRVRFIHRKLAKKNMKKYPENSVVVVYFCSSQKEELASLHCHDFFYPHTNYLALLYANPLYYRAAACCTQALCELALELALEQVSGSWWNAIGKGALDVNKVTMASDKRSRFAPCPSNQASTTIAPLKFQCTSAPTAKLFAYVARMHRPSWLRTKGKSKAKLGHAEASSSAASSRSNLATGAETGLGKSSGGL